MEILAGNSDFKAVREQGYYYVDKSLLVADVLRSGAMVMLITRPRRFGKTLNLSMLDAFFQCEEDNRSLFAGLAIERDAEAMAHLGAYPTVSLSFKSLDCQTWDDCQAKIKDLFAALFLKHKSWIDRANPQYVELRNVNAILDGSAPMVVYQDALRLLTQLLQRATSKRVMLLIDEYDTPINAGQLNQYFDQVVAFIRSLMNAGMKDNTALERGVLTGILRVAKESIFSGMNNVHLFTMLNERFSPHFGFSQAEVARVLDDFSLCQQKDGVTAWYNGYRIGNQMIFNPWSIMSMASFGGKLDIYWVNTSNNELIKKLLTSDRTLAEGDLTALLQGKPIRRKISDSIILRDIQPNDVWSLLFYSGYLTFQESRSGPNDIYELIIPNLEVRHFFEDTVKSWLGHPNHWDVIKDSLLRDDMAAFEEHISTYFNKAPSFHDFAGRPGVQSENLYHALFLGMLIYQQDSYEISSNRESGRGRYDIVLIPKMPNGTGYIFEFKQATLSKLPEVAEQAVEQIIDRQYWRSLPEIGDPQRWMLVGIAFCGKDLALAHKRLDPLITHQGKPPAAPETLTLQIQAKLENILNAACLRPFLDPLNRALGGRSPSIEPATLASHLLGQDVTEIIRKLIAVFYDDHHEQTFLAWDKGLELVGWLVLMGVDSSRLPSGPFFDLPINTLLGAEVVLAYKDRQPAAFVERNGELCGANAIIFPGSALNSSDPVGAVVEHIASAINQPLPKDFGALQLARINGVLKSARRRYYLVSDQPISEWPDRHSILKQLNGLVVVHMQKGNMAAHSLVPLEGEWVGAIETYLNEKRAWSARHR